MGACRLLKWVGVYLSGVWESKLRTFSRPMLLTINELQRFTLTWFCRRFVPNNILIILSLFGIIPNSDDSAVVVSVLPIFALFGHTFLPYVIAVLLPICYHVNVVMPYGFGCQQVIYVCGNLVYILFCADSTRLQAIIEPPQHSATTTTLHPYHGTPLPLDLCPTLVSNVRHVNT